jgi:hypothetical protein
LLPKLSVIDSVKILRRRFPGSLICTACGRLIASTPAGYEKLNLPAGQVENYVCHGCRSDADPARSVEVTARFAASKNRICGRTSSSTARGSVAVTGRVHPDRILLTGRSASRRPCLPFQAGVPARPL